MLVCMKTKQERQELFERREAERKAKYVERMNAVRERDDRWKAERAERAAAVASPRGASLGERWGYRAKLAGGMGSPWGALVVWVLPYRSLAERVPLGLWEGTLKP